MDLRRRGPDPLVAAALSAIWPGLGHFGHRTRRALLFANGTLMAYVFALGYVVARGTRTLLLWTVNVSSLRILMVGRLLLLATSPFSFLALLPLPAHRRGWAPAVASAARC